MKKNCLTCGKEFPKLPSHSRKYWLVRKYCTQTCAEKTIVTEAFREKISKTSKGKHYSFATEFKKGNCKPKGAYSFLRGDKNPTWKGGVYGTFRHRLMGLIEYKQWRESVFDRDNYTCQTCGIRGAKLNADHIHRYVDIIKEYRIKTVEEALGCSVLWDIKNGRTLCVPCHKQVTF